eukprot:scaffold30384_cov53-Attheya_sp.AAC.4
MAENKRFFTVLVRKGEAVVPIPDRSSSKDRCCCNWSECSQWRGYFEKDDPTGLRSGCCFTLQVNGLGKFFDEQSQREYASSILSSLAVTDAEFSTRKQQKLLVARHHYDPRQLTLFKQNRQARNMPLTREAMRMYTNGLVEFNVMAGGNNIEERFFHIPNFEKTAVQRQVEGSAIMSRSERAQQLEQRRLEHEVREQADAEKAVFQNQSFEDFCEQRRAMAELRKELAGAFETGKALSVQLDKEKGARKNAERKLDYWKEKADPHKYLRQKRRHKNKKRNITTTTTRNTEVISTFIHASDPSESHDLNLGNSL